MNMREDILCVRLTADNLIRLASRPWLFWVKQARQWHWSGSIALPKPFTAGAGTEAYVMRATGCYLYRVGP